MGGSGGFSDRPQDFETLFEDQVFPAVVGLVFGFDGYAGFKPFAMDRRPLRAHVLGDRQNEKTPFGERKVLLDCSAPESVLADERMVLVFEGSREYLARPRGP